MILNLAWVLYKTTSIASTSYEGETNGQVQTTVESWNPFEFHFKGYLFIVWCGQHIVQDA